MERKVIEIVGELYGQYTQLSKMSEEEREWLEERGVSLDQDPVHTAAGLNDDYPLGRGVFKEERGQFVVLTNFEDHIEIQMMPGSGENLFSAL